MAKSYLETKEFNFFFSRRYHITERCQERNCRQEIGEKKYSKRHGEMALVGFILMHCSDCFFIQPVKENLNNIRCMYRLSFKIYKKCEIERQKIKC